MSGAAPAIGLELQVSQLPLEELRRQWAVAWGVDPHPHIGRGMLEISLEYKQLEAAGGGLSAEQRKRLDSLIAAYKRNPEDFEQGPGGLKPGTRLVREVKGEKHVVLVRTDGFEHQGTTYTSLSEIAHAITGTRWNGWVFFGLKKRKLKEQGT